MNNQPEDSQGGVALPEDKKLELLKALLQAAAPSSGTKLIPRIQQAQSKISTSSENSQGTSLNSLGAAL